MKVLIIEDEYSLADAIDVNGNLYINGGTIDITGNSPFDYDGEGKLSGGKVIKII